ncbi:MAG TPA: hypothetical protein VGR84_18920 [Candidatus Acidoferrales bacterium]|nr:hypothetical protein [Candidatus Acidoferrales bacterium]
MAGKHGLFGTPPWLLPAIAGALTLGAGGLGAAGLFGGEAAGAGVGAGAADAGFFGTDAGASALLAAPDTAALGAGVEAPLAAGTAAGVGDIGIGGALGGAATDLGASAAPLLSGAVTPLANETALATADVGPGVIGAGTNVAPAAGAEGVTAPLTAAMPAAAPSVSESLGATLGQDATAFGGGGPGGADVLSATGGAGSDFASATPSETGLAGIWNNIKTPLSIASTVGGLGLMLPQLFKGPQSYPPQQQEQGLVNQEVALANQYQAPLLSGVLPPGAQSWVNLAKAANTAAVTGADANLGIGGSTMEAQQLQAVNEAAAGQTFQIAENLSSLGAQYANMAGGQLQSLTQTAMQEDEAYQTALTNFARALGSLGGGSNLFGTSPSAYDVAA